MKKVLAPWAISTILWPLSSLAVDASCIKSAVKSGNQCQNLMVEFDFSRCGAEAPPVRHIKSVCVNQKAVAVYRAIDAMYIATYAG